MNFSKTKAKYASSFGKGGEDSGTEDDADELGGDDEEEGGGDAMECVDAIQTALDDLKKKLKK